MKTTRLSFVLLFAACSTSPHDPYAGADSTPDSSGKADGSSQLVGRVTERDLVSDRDGAATKDPNLVNAWGLAFNPAGPVWVSNAGTATSTVYDGAGALKLTVTFPLASGSPTGQVFNGSPDFAGDKFIFGSEDGRIYAWQPATGVVVRSDSSAGGAVYKGLAIATDSTGAQRLYATDFHNGAIDVFDARYQRVKLDGDFADYEIPAGYAPFNAQTLEGKILVSYAKQDADAHDDVPGAGNGFVDQFDTDGHLERRLISHGALSSAWGLAIAPASWASLAGKLLVGNFGNGLVHAYDVHVADGYGGERVQKLGTLAGTSGGPLAIEGLWALAVGPDGSLYFSAGPGDESHGLLGTLAPN